MEKWEWIVERLRDLARKLYKGEGIPTAEEILTWRVVFNNAIKLRNFIRKIYGEPAPYWKFFESYHTARFKKFVEKGEYVRAFEEVENVAGETDYCIACVKHEGDCRDCLLAGYLGWCLANESAYGQFWTSFSELKWLFEYLEESEKEEVIM